MNHVLIVVANMKWNCNIVKEMYDRVLRRKFGMLCSDDTSNENFIKSYLNRLDCTPIDLSCLKGSNLPCTSSEASSTVVCNIIVNVVVTIVNNNFVFTASVTNAVLPVSYNWTYDTSVFQLVSNVANVLTLEPILLFSGSVAGNVEVVVTDTDKCTGSWDDKINYRGGCTDPEAVNYDPLATIDNGTCYYDPLLISSAYECQEDDTGTLCIQASGGTPPYTVVGVPNGTILLDGGNLCQNLPNGTTFSFYVIDSLGTVSLIQRGTIGCPFDCETVTILSNFEVECLTDGLGNNTGEALLTLTPSGGNAPYSVTGSINGSPYGNFTQITPGVFSPGQSVNNGDKIYVIITDSNGCTTTDSITIDCPLPDPGPGGDGFDCVDFGEINILSSMFVSSISNTLVGLSVKLRALYNINFQLTNLGSLGLNYANIATFEYKLQNVSLGLFDHYPFGMSGSPCNPCIGSLTHLTTSSPIVYNTSNSIGLSPSHTAIISSTCSPGAFKKIDAIIKVRLTVVTEDVVCTLCFSGTLKADVSCDAGSGGSSIIGLTLIDCDEY
jgi:hypothetical protein